MKIEKPKLKKKGLLIVGWTAILRSLKPEEMKTYDVSELDGIFIHSLRSRAGEINKLAGYTQYSVSFNRLTKTVTVIHNKP